MIYPFVDEGDIPDSQDLVIPKEYEINFETGQLTGKLVEGLDAVMVWVWKVLQSPKNRYYIYSEEYGQEFEDLVGQPRNLAEMEYQRMICDCLLQNKYITGIEDYVFEIDNSGKVNISFTLLTIFGEGGVNVRDEDIRVNYE